MIHPPLPTYSHSPIGAGEWRSSVCISREGIELGSGSVSSDVQRHQLQRPQSRRKGRRLRQSHARDAPLRDRGRALAAGGSPQPPSSPPPPPPPPPPRAAAAAAAAAARASGGTAAGARGRGTRRSGDEGCEHGVPTAAAPQRGAPRGGVSGHEGLERGRVAGAGLRGELARLQQESSRGSAATAAGSVVAAQAER